GRRVPDSGRAQPSFWKARSWKVVGMMNIEPKSFENALLVEDESHLAAALEVALRKLGIPTRRVSTLREARTSFSRAQPDFILLDRALPDGDGIELCQELRRDGYHGTILMLTAKGETTDRVAGLHSGADDYLVKPFSWDELGARIGA